jgi:peroxiredoxin
MFYYLICAVLLLIVSMLYGRLYLYASSLPLQPDERGYIVKVGDPAPSFTLTLTDGSTTSFEDLKGRVILLQFTASWCSVCRQEMPHIEKEIWQVYRDRGLVVIGVDRDEPLETVQQFAHEMGITYPLALDPGAEIFAKFAVKESGVTRNVLIDQEGTIAFLTRLFDRREFDALIQKIDYLLNGNQ